MAIINAKFRCAQRVQLAGELDTVYFHRREVPFIPGTSYHLTFESTP